MAPDHAEATPSPPTLERRTLCLPSVHPGIPKQWGESGFVDNLATLFPAAENNAVEKLVQLKTKLKHADTETFWRVLMEGMTDICHAQYGFVAKRILTDDYDSAVEMPSYGDEGSCLMGVAFYYNDGHQHEAMHRDYRYIAWGSPCAHMKHEKVFVIPDNMSAFVPHNPNAFPFPAEGYLGIPLFHDDKCFAHFGLMWSQQGLERRDTSWTYTEMLLHSLEDLVVERLVSGQGFAKPPAKSSAPLPQVIPREAVTPTTQSLRPYAKNLSHELRTPMQGVVGMLDVMLATVQEQIERHSHATIRRVFQALRENIETVQDSAKRAVEAADNVVHAYDMNMQIPDTPSHDTDSPATASATTGYFDHRPARLIEGSDIHVTGFKRRRSSPTAWHFGNAPKIRQLVPVRADVSPKSGGTPFPPPAATPRTTGAGSGSDTLLPPVFTPWRGDLTPRELSTPSTKAAAAAADGEALTTPSLKHCRIREVLPLVIHECLRVGGRPDSATGEATEGGEQIVVRSRSSNGHVSQKVINWSVAATVPELVYADERDLAKLVSAVFLNAIKFTENGAITLDTRLSKTQKSLLIGVKDTGDGIPEDFQPELFKPFSREDDSLTRSKEGLGLGLLVAKGLARRLGGDITLVRSETSGPDQGSEFEIKLPLEPTDPVSHTGTPRGRTPDRSQSLSQHAALVTSAHPSHEATTDKSPSPRLLQHLKLSAHPTPLERRTPPAEPRRVSSAPTVPVRQPSHDRKLAEKYPLTFLVAEDNKINRKLLVSMLGKLGYTEIHEAFDGKEAVRIMQEIKAAGKGSGSNGKQCLQKVDVILMDLWMPEMDGYQATESILGMFQDEDGGRPSHRSMTAPVVLAVSADVTDEAIERATRTGMEGFMTKPYKLMDLQKLIVEFCLKSDGVRV